VLSQHAGLAVLLAEDDCCGAKSSACDEGCPPQTMLRPCCAERTLATPPAEGPREVAVQRTKADLPEAETLVSAPPAKILHVPKLALS
jgi:hypothetical protein